MSNLTGRATPDALDARGLVVAELRERAIEVPASPFDWAAFDAGAVLRVEGASADARLSAMQRQLCSSPARAAELLGLWSESVTTAAFAWRIAGDVGSCPDTAAIAGLVHRLGDILTIRAIAAIEHAGGVRLDAMARHDLCAELGAGMLDRTLRAWGVPARAAAVAVEWRQRLDFPELAADATAIHLGRLLALELLAPQFCAPGALSAAATAAGLCAGRLSALRADATIARLLVNLQ